MTDREGNVYRAKLAEQAERYDEMVEAMKSVASMDVELTVEESKGGFRNFWKGGRGLEPDFWYSQ